MTIAGETVNVQFLNKGSIISEQNPLPVRNCFQTPGGLWVYQKYADTGEVLMQLTGSTLQEEKTQANAVTGVVTFSANISTIEILNTDTVNTGVFTVNGIPITVPPTGIWKDGVGGTPGATVTVAGSTAYILHRFS